MLRCLAGKPNRSRLKISSSIPTPLYLPIPKSVSAAMIVQPQDNKLYFLPNEQLLSCIRNFSFVCALGRESSLTSLLAFVVYFYGISLVLGETLTRLDCFLLGFLFSVKLLRLCSRRTTYFLELALQMKPLRVLPSCPPKFYPHSFRVRTHPV